MRAASIEEDQRRFGRLMAAAETAEADAAPETVEGPIAPSTRPPVVELLEAAARALANFHMAEDKLDDQTRISVLLRDAERLADPAVARAIHHVRCTWSAYEIERVLRQHKNLDTANIVRGIELVAWSMTVTP